MGQNWLTRLSAGSKSSFKLSSSSSFSEEVGPGPYMAAAKSGWVYWRPSRATATAANAGPTFLPSFRIQLLYSKIRALPAKDIRKSYRFRSSQSQRLHRAISRRFSWCRSRDSLVQSFASVEWRRCVKKKKSDFSDIANFQHLQQLQYSYRLPETWCRLTLMFYLPNAMLKSRNDAVFQKFL
jgi:hypothetical protein